MRFPRVVDVSFKDRHFIFLVWNHKNDLRSKNSFKFLLPRFVRNLYFKSIEIYYISYFVQIYFVLFKRVDVKGEVETLLFIQILRDVNPVF